MNSVDWAIIATSALLGGVGHCIGMCGGIVIAYSSKKLEKKKGFLTESVLHLLYNLGRVTAYIIIGLLAGLAGKAFAFSPTTKGLLFLIAGVVLIYAGLSLLGKVRFLNTSQPFLSKFDLFKKSFSYLLSSPSPASFYALGVLNGFIPCGLVYSFAIIAASTASPLYGAMVMAIFGIATIPSLFFLGHLTKLLQKSSLRSVMQKLSALLVIAYALLMLYKGYLFFAHPQQMQKMMQSKEEMKCAPGKCGAGMKCGFGKCG